MAMSKICPCPSNIIGYNTENVCYDVVLNSQVLSYPVKIKIKIQQTL